MTIYILYKTKQLLYTIILLFLIASIDTKLTANNLVYKLELDNLKSDKALENFAIFLDITQRIPLIFILIDIITLICY